MSINDKKKELKYNYAQKLINEKHKDKSDYQKIIDLLTELGDYKDAKELIPIYQQKITKKNNTNILWIINIALICFIALGLFLIPKFIESQRYNEIVKLYEAKDYNKALVKIKKIGNYKDTENLYTNICLEMANKYIENDNLDEALRILMPISNYDMAKSIILKIYYDKGMQAYENDDIYNAVNYLDKAEDYKDSIDLILDMKKEYIENHSDKSDSILLGYINDLKYTKYKEESANRLREVYGWSGTLKVMDIYGNEIKNKKLPEEFKIKLEVHGGMHQEKANFNWYEYDSNNKLISTGTYCSLIDGDSCLTSTKYKSSKARGYAVYYGNENDGYKVGEIRW